MNVKMRGRESHAYLRGGSGQKKIPFQRSQEELDLRKNSRSSRVSTGWEGVPRIGILFVRVRSEVTRGFGEEMTGDGGPED